MFEYLYDIIANHGTLNYKLINLIIVNSEIFERVLFSRNFVQSFVNIKSWRYDEITDIYLTPVKTQLLQYILTRDLMLFYHSIK